MASKFFASNPLDAMSTEITIKAPPPPPPPPPRVARPAPSPEAQKMAEQVEQVMEDLAEDQAKQQVINQKDARRAGLKLSSKRMCAECSIHPVILGTSMCAECTLAAV